MPYFQYETFRMHYEVVRGLVPSDTLLIHGNLASNLWWQAALDSWEKLKRKEESPDKPWQGVLVMAEWRGCGKSAGPSSESDMDFSILANDYVELLLNLGMHKANVVGHATGGMIALHAMRQVPAIFRRAVLLNSVPARGVPFSAEMQASFLQMSRDRELVKEVLARAIYLNDPLSPLFEKIVDQACASHPLVWAHILKRLAGVDFTAQLTDVRHPTLVMHGVEDPILPVSGSEELARTLPEGRLQLLEHQGHSCNVENPERFVAHAHRFLFG